MDPRDPPQHNKEETPESKRAMQVPIDARKLRPPAHGKTATPIVYPWPPYDGSCQTKQRQTDPADAVHKTTGRSQQKIRMELYDPPDGGQPR